MRIFFLLPSFRFVEEHSRGEFLLVPGTEGSNVYIFTEQSLQKLVDR